jgi:ketosteroid isomerase-like protein
MSQENVVRTPLRHPIEPRRSRSVDEGLCVRFPSLLPMIVAGLLRLPPRSRVRRILLQLGVRRGWAASDRGDLDLVLCAYDPDVEVRWPETGAAAFPDLRGTYRGHDGFREIWGALHDPWHVEVQLHELIDAGKRLLVLGEMSLRGKGSGIRASATLVQVLTFRSGRILREEWFNSREEALEAAGLLS